MQSQLWFFYRTLLVSYAGSIALCLASGFVIPPIAFTVTGSFVFIAFSGIMARRIAYWRTADALEGFGLIYGQGAALYLFLFPATALSAPLADPWLAAADRALGFDFVGVVTFLSRYFEPLNFLYRSFDWQPAVIVLALAAGGRSRRLHQLNLAAFIALAITILIYAAAPADGAYVHHGIPGGTLVPGMGPWAFAPVIHEIRDGARHLTPEMFTGFVSFPSYHAVAAVQFAWASWPVRWLRWPIVILNLGMVAATPLIGAHYFIDLVAGAALGFGALRAADWWLERETAREQVPSGQGPETAGLLRAH